VTPPAASPTARILACHVSANADQRSVTVGTWMRPRPDAPNVMVKLELYQRPVQVISRWTRRDDVPGLGVWMLPSDASLSSPTDLFHYRQSIGRLNVGYSYRFRVSFRWLDESRRLVNSAVLTTGPCRQPDLRPDLVLSDLRVEPAPGRVGDFLYTLVVTNQGPSPSPHAILAATFPSGTGGRTIPKLASGARKAVTFEGPGCTPDGRPAVFTIDVANAIPERDELNNQLAATCPTPAG
jgi:hypothetical protein